MIGSNIVHQLTITLSVIILSSIAEELHPCNRECVSGAPPIKCQYEFKVQWYQSLSKACYDCPYNMTDCYRPDCIPLDGGKRSIITVNKQIPGPLIQACVGDMVEVIVENHLPDETTSVHWHGHHQRGSPYMDGVPFITQCPILPKSRFKYLFEATTTGTHFWHSHSGTQRGDGMFGGLIIKSPKTQDRHGRLYDYDLSEHVMTILDWHHKMGIATFLEHHHSDGDNKPNSILVNGRGRYQGFFDEKKNEMVYTPIAVFNVRAGNRYRFRLINAGFLNCPIEMSIDNHTITVINSDGGDIEPTETTSLVSYAGERWDFILNAKENVSNYWIRYRGLMDCDERFTKAFQVAVLHYEGAPDPAVKGPEGFVTYENSHNDGKQINPLNEGSSNENTLNIPELISREPLAKNDLSLKEQADITHFLAYDFYPKDNPHYHKKKLYGFNSVGKKNRVLTPQINHISMKLPPFPLLPQRDEIKPGLFCELQKAKNCTEEYCECTHLIHIPFGKVVELILVDEGVAYDANHPFHLHGHPFRVIAMERVGKNVTIEEIKALDKAGLVKRNLKTAPLKDTVTVPDGGYTIVRFHATNPGYWLFHCHIEFHVEMGMAVVFKIGEDENMPPVPRGFPKCGDYTPSIDEEIRMYDWNQTQVTSSQKTVTVSPEKISSASVKSTQELTETKLAKKATTETTLSTTKNESKAPTTSHIDKQTDRNKSDQEELKIDDIYSILQLIRGNIVKTEYRYGPSQQEPQTTTFYNLLETGEINQVDSQIVNETRNTLKRTNLDEFHYALIPIEIKTNASDRAVDQKNISDSENEISHTLSTANRHYLKYNEPSSGIDRIYGDAKKILITPVLLLVVNYSLRT